jgi:cytochrome c6
MRRIFAGSLLVVSTIIGAASLPLRATTGAEIFAIQCAMCHGPDGRAKTPIARKIGVKDLTVSALPPDAIARQVREGFAQNGTQKMPAFRGRLSDEEIRMLVDYVLTLRRP